MRKQTFLITSALIPILISLTPAAFAEDFEAAATDDALKKTMELLNNPALRQGAMTTDQAKKADSAAEIAAGGNSQTKNDIYSLSSNLFQKITAEAKGDSNKMIQMLLEAQRNPASFAQKYFPPGSPEAAELKAIADKSQAPKAQP